MGAHRPRHTLGKASLILLTAALAQVAAAAEIVRWVDENGVTQFTDPQLAAAPATTVDVQPANAMVVPTGAPASAATGPSFTRISKAPKKNKRGWQGYQIRGSRNRR